MKTNLHKQALTAIRIMYPNLTGQGSEFTTEALMRLFAQYEAGATKPPETSAFFIRSFERDCCKRFDIELDSLGSIRLMPSHVPRATPYEDDEPFAYEGPCTPEECKRVLELARRDKFDEAQKIIDAARERMKQETA
jgi:hypothetical protein